MATEPIPADTAQSTASLPSSLPSALLLLPGDPLPGLPVDPVFSLDAFAGRWLLLVSCDVARVMGLRALEADVQRLRSCTVRALVRGVETADAPHFADTDRRAADALGALAGAGGRADVAVLLDPRGRVQWSEVWGASEALVAGLGGVWTR